MVIWNFHKKNWKIYDKMLDMWFHLWKIKPKNFTHNKEEMEDTKWGTFKFDYMVIGSSLLPLEVNSLRTMVNSRGGQEVFWSQAKHGKSTNPWCTPKIWLYRWNRCECWGLHSKFCGNWRFPCWKNSIFSAHISFVFSTPKLHASKDCLDSYPNAFGSQSPTCPLSSISKFILH